MCSINALIDTYWAILLSVNTRDNTWSVTKVFSVHELLLGTYVKWLELEEQEAVVMATRGAATTAIPAAWELPVLNEENDQNV